jgi:hypothetical protein
MYVYWSTHSYCVLSMYWESLPPLVDQEQTRIDYNRLQNLAWRRHTWYMVCVFPFSSEVRKAQPQLAWLVHNTYTSSVYIKNLHWLCYKVQMSVQGSELTEEVINSVPVWAQGSA